MKKLNEIVNFLLGKEKRAYALIGAMSEGASIEHPMSIHSAPIGTSRRPAGIKAVIRCMAAMFVMLFTLGVGNAWGVNYYGTGRVVAKRFGGDDANFGKVGVKVYTTAGGKTSYTGTYAIDTIPRPTNLPKYNTSGNVYISCYAQVNEASGYTFEGWYSDPECETLAPDCGVVDSDSKGVYYVYKVSRTSIPHGTSDTNTSVANATVMYTVYAKFVKGSTTNKFQTKLTVSTESTSKGVVNVSKTGVDPWGWGVYQYDVDSEHPLTRGKDTKTVTGDQEETEETSTAQTYYVYALPLRGYEFSSWTTGTGVTLTPDYYCDEGAWCNTSAFDVSVSTDNTKTNGVYGYTGTLTANFTALEETFGFSVEKEAGIGSATVAYANWEYDSTDKLARKRTHDLTTLSLSDTKKTYSGLYSTDEIILTATPEDGFVFVGWYVNSSSEQNVLLSDEATATATLYEDGMTFIPVFAPNMDNLDVLDADNFLVGTTLCQTFEQALTAATQGQFKTIVLLKDYTVPAGNYTIPAGVTLLIPKDADQTSPATSVNRFLTADAPSGIFRTLTLAEGLHLEVYGTIEVGGDQSAGTEGGGGEEGIGVPTGTLGRLYMKDGSSITLNNGAILRAWGYVLGDKDNDGKYLCEIDARRGSKVYEQFQIMDWKGGTYTIGMFDGNNSNIDSPTSHKVLPINQYYIQNVEVPVKYRPGARLSGAGSVSMYGSILVMDEAGVIGAKYTYSQDDAIFLMNDEDDSEDTWVRKYYDATTDQQVYEANNSAYLGSLVVNFSGIEANSREYKLPITNNFKIHLLNGQMEVTQHTEFLAGSELEINKKSTLTIPQDVNVYLYDKEDWGRYITVARESGGACVFGSGTTVKWRPDGRPTVRRDVAPNDTVKIFDTKLTISGTIDIKGKLFTTTHGATVISTNEDAGTVIFSSDAPANSTVSQITALPADGSHDSNYKRISSTSVQLQNADGSLTKTYTDADHHAVSGQSYCFINGAWRSFVQEDQCFISETVAEVKTYYAKPQDLVALSSGEEDENHLFYSSDGSRTFIHAFGNDGNCQWWEVTATATPGIYHCEHPKNNTYYYYHNGDWLEKKFKVSWVNWDGSPVNYTNSEDQQVNYYMVSYGAIPQWLSANPKRPEDAGYYTYDFVGWNPTPTAVTADAVYTAKYERQPVMYAITFNNANDELIEINYYQRDNVPVCVHYTLGENEKWTPAIAPVTGDQVYTLATKTAQSDYTIIWKNWNGTTLETDEHVTGTPTYDGAIPTKPALGEIAYAFSGWYPEVVAATEDAVYVAQFHETANNMEVNNGSTVNVTVNTIRDTVTIHTGGTVIVDNGKNLTLSHLVVESNGSDASGQLIAVTPAQLTAASADFDYKVNAKNHKWYGVAVPWQVDATTGISVNGKTLELGKDFDIIYYDGERRAAEGKQKCWKYVENDGDKTLQPGRLYMIGLMLDAPTIRFTKKAGAALLTTSTSVSGYPSAVATDANWNGVANPALFHAFVNAGADDAIYGPNIGQVYNPETNSYNTVDMSSAKFVVGQGAFVQATEGKSIVVSCGGAYAAPRRAKAEKAPLYDVRIAAAEAEYTDRLFVRVEDEKEADKYVIGKDLAKLGVSKSVAQMWINRYNTELCLNTMTMENGVAEYPLGIYAPKAGEYTITIHNAQFTIQNEVYLTLNGEAIWNLSDAAYTGTFDAGTTNAYGLRISAKSPQIATGIDEAVVDAKGETRKVLIDNKVYIIRGEKVYTIDGQLVK